MLFHTIVVGMCACRAPTDPAVVFTWFSIIFRLGIVYAHYLKSKKMILMMAAVGEACMNIILFGIAMAGYTTY